MADPDAYKYNKDYSSHPTATDQEKKILTETQGGRATPPPILNKYIGAVQGNILDTVDLPTYHLKLYMIPPGQANSSANNTNTPTTDTDVSDSNDARSDVSKSTSSSGSGDGYLNNRMDTDNPSDTVVLAETGVTEVGIDGLEITTVASGSGGSKTSTVNFTIRQPNAADFPDQIVKARTFLGAPADAMDVPMFLEVSFRGRMEGLDLDVDGGEIVQNITGPFVYPLLLGAFDMEINPGGSVYNFKTVVKDDIYQADKFFRTSKAYTIRGVTIGQMLKDLEDQTNNYNEEQNKPTRISFGLEESGTKDVTTSKEGKTVSTFSKTGKLTITNETETDTKTKPDYKVAGLEHIADQSLDVEGAEVTAKAINPEVANADTTEQAREEAEKKRKARNTINTNPETNEIEINVKEGMPMDKVLGILLSMNKEFMDKVSRTRNIEDTKSEEVDATKQVLWYDFQGSVEYKGYDEQKKLYFQLAHLKPYSYMSDKTDIAAFHWEVKKNNSLTADETQQRINQMKIRKAYEYIFTGRNDQILNCNIQFKEGLALLLPPDRGMLGDISLNSQHILNPSPVPKNETIDNKGMESLTDAAQDGQKSFLDTLKDLKKDIEKAEAYLTEIGNAAQFSGEQIKNLIEDSNGAAAKKLEEALSQKESAQAIADNITAKRKASAQSDVVTESEEFSPIQSGFVYGGDLIGTNKYSERLAKGGAQFKEFAAEQEEKRKDKEVVENDLRGTAQRAKFEYKEGFTNVGTTKGIKNNLFTYLYDQHQAIEFLMRLEMELRGDPFYLGRDVHIKGTTKQPVGFDSEKLKETDEDGNNYLTTTKDNFFLFSLNSPRLFDPDSDNEDNNTGLWQNNGDGTSYFISGIYQLRDVIHKFNNGSYTMDIMGVKEMAISLDKAGRNGEFTLFDTSRSGRTSGNQDGTWTSSDDDRVGSTDGKPWPEYVSGRMTSSEKTAEQLLKDKEISPDQYQAWKKLQDEKKKKKQKEDERRGG